MEKTFRPENWMFYTRKRCAHRHNSSDYYVAQTGAVWFWIVAWEPEHTMVVSVPLFSGAPLAQLLETGKNTIVTVQIND